MTKILSKAVLTIVFSLVSIPANAVTYTFTHLETPSGSRSVANSINNSGQIVGITTNSNNTSWQAMLWNNGVAIQLDTGDSHAYGINNSGQIVGKGSNGRATLWDNGSITDLGLPGEVSQALSINDSGQVVGSAYNAGNSVTGATIWNNGIPTALVPLDATNNPGGVANGINSSGQIVGASFLMGNWHAALWDNGVTTDLGVLGNGNTSRANSINDSGQIVGWSSSEGANMTHATLWSNGGITDLGTLGNGINNYSQAQSINNSGQIVGFTFFYDDGFNFSGGAATLWSNGYIVDLNTLLSASDVAAGWSLISANSINDDGSIVGQARNNLLGINAGAFLMSVNPVPEADTSAMLLMGAGVMGFIARRRKNAQA